MPFLATSYYNLAIPLSLRTLERKIIVLEDTVRSLMNAQKHNSDINLQSAVLKAQVLIVLLAYKEFYTYYLLTYLPNYLPEPAYLPA